MALPLPGFHFRAIGFLFIFGFVLATHRSPVSISISFFELKVQVKLCKRHACYNKNETETMQQLKWNKNGFFLSFSGDFV